MPRHSIKSLLIDYKIHPIDPHDLDFVRLCVENGTPLIAFFKVYMRNFSFLHLIDCFFYFTEKRGYYCSLPDDAVLQGS